MYFMYMLRSVLGDLFTVMAQTYLRPWKFVRDMGSSSHWDLIMAPDQEANDDHLGMSFRSSAQQWYVECTH